LLAGFETVRESMADPIFLAYVRRLMHKEIIPTLLETEINRKEAEAFADEVIYRFSNPYLHHQWQSISANYTSKMQLRNLATLQRYYKKGKSKVADYMALGFAGYLRVAGHMESRDLLALWENELRPLGDFLPTVERYVIQLQQREVLAVIQDLDRDE
ncbi:MAG TPA: hypothetical protein VNQ55_03630, partial [Parapedobacter sp.]|nr:hypothetical protein [Parapedobacter sp.]